MLQPGQLVRQRLVELHQLRAARPFPRSADPAPRAARPGAPPRRAARCVASPPARAPEDPTAAQPITPSSTRRRSARHSRSKQWALRGPVVNVYFRAMRRGGPPISGWGYPHRRIGRDIPTVQRGGEPTPVGGGLAPHRFRGVASGGVGDGFIVCQDLSAHATRSARQVGRERRQAVNTPASKSVMRIFGRLREAARRGVLLHSRTKPTAQDRTSFLRRIAGRKWTT